MPARSSLRRTLTTQPLVLRSSEITRPLPTRGPEFPLHTAPEISSGFQMGRLAVISTHRATTGKPGGNFNQFWGHQLNFFFLIFVIDLSGRQICCLGRVFFSFTPSSNLICRILKTLEGLLKLTRCPSRAHKIALNLASGTKKMQGHSQNRSPWLNYTLSLEKTDK